MQMTDSSDPQLHLKKKARRRLVGAIAIAGLAAVILPMVMDEEPKQPVQDIQIRIPGQEQLPFDPAELAARSSHPAAVAEARGEQSTAALTDEGAPPPEAGEADSRKASTPPAERPVEKTTVKPAEKATPRKAEKPADPRPVAIDRAPPDPPPAVAANGQYVVLVGAFADPANVTKLLARIQRVGVPTYTEVLNSPAGKRTRVRAGPFPNREAAEKALDKLKKIDVGGVVAARS